MPGTNPTLLVVDDDADIRSAVADFLQRNGFTVELAAHGKEALTRLQANPSIALVVSDLLMPEMGGLELLTQIRAGAQAGKEKIPFVLISGKLTRDEFSIAVKQGASAFVVKPFESKNLVQKIQELLSQKPDEGQLKRLSITLVNLTSKSRPVRTVSLLGFREKTLSLSIPTKLCTTRHHLEITFTIGESETTAYEMRCTGHVESLTRISDTAERAELTLLQVVEHEWEEMQAWLSNPTEQMAFKKIRKKKLKKAA